MNAIREAFLREQLLQRRERLQTALTEFNEAKQIDHLIDEIDAALKRLSNGSFGICEECKDPIETDRLLADPCLRFCLDHLTQDQRTALEHDLQLAAIIQNRLLPKLPIQADGWDIHYHYQPAGAVSGDYCDILTDSTNGNIYFIIGDVSGKGVAASMLMTHLHALFRSLTAQRLPLEQLMEQANRVFNESTMSSLFATLVCGKLTNEGLVEVCNAGHCPPIILHKDRTATIKATGIPLGIFSQSTYEIHREELTSGDSLIIYTDGVSETRNDKNLEYGDERTVETIQKFYDHSSGVLIDTFMNELDTFRGSAPRSDDVTFMVIRRTA